MMDNEHDTGIRAAMKVVVLSTVEQFLNRDYDSVHSINCGGCYDFADAVSESAKFEGRYCSDVLETGNFTLGEEGGSEQAIDPVILEAHWPKCVPPSPLSWRDLDDLGFADMHHGWITANGRHYDADAPDGVDNFFELPIFRRNFASVMSRDEKRWPGILDSSDWWRESLRMSRDYAAWVDARRSDCSREPVRAEKKRLAAGPAPG